eukprot:CAMPEP_0202891478 /NCGR_PEP_ID=MMETSP1392-20130828/1525_1 /ASSEMBLY_ACC=CAM_ASM_000868 /TAXON_ID=225041 /ORGANISM="Chlamydomonas chlamydogama, Strain SAG 11-48b" /LENGTH=557 /DNA_ID=CAMNT_0049575239 /DNA_START=228 /DNA_END=1901 /DNA_ORIENTATION=+
MSPSAEVSARPSISRALPYQADGDGLSRTSLPLSPPTRLTSVSADQLIASLRSLDRKDAALHASVAEAVMQLGIHTLSPASLADLFCVLAEARHPAPDFYTAAVRVLAANVQALPPLSLGELLWACHRVLPSETASLIVPDLVKQATFKIYDFKPQELVQLLTALAKGPSPSAPEMLLEGAHSQLTLYISRGLLKGGADLTQALWALARLGSYNRAVFDAAKRRLLALPPAAAGTGACCGGLGTAATGSTASASSLDGDDASDGSSSGGADGSNAARAEDGEGGGGGAPAFEREDVVQSMDGSELARLAWAFVTVRQQDERHRTLHDVPLLNTIVDRAHRILSSFNPHDLITLLAAYSSVPHYELRFYHDAATALLGSLSGGSSSSAGGADAAAAGQEGGLSKADVIAAAWAYARVQHRASKPFVEALLSEALKYTSQYEPEELLHLARTMTSTGAFSDPLMRYIVQRAVTCHVGSTDTAAGKGSVNGSAALAMPLFDAVQLLELARILATVQHHNTEFYSSAQADVLRAVNDAYMAVDIEEQTTYCGCTDPNGLQK